jgi:phosphinothricin acetyltransferase
MSESGGLGRADGEGDGDAPLGEVELRPARRSDLEDINAIYNHYVLDSTATYQNEPDSLEERERWFAGHGPRHPVLVACSDGELLGWGALSRFHPRAAYLHTVEDSIYVHHLHRGRGLGHRLLSELIAGGRAAGHRSIIAAVSADQEPSLRLHARCGFREAGRLHEVGYKFTRWLDVVYLQLALAPGAQPGPAAQG